MRVAAAIAAVLLTAAPAGATAEQATVTVVPDAASPGDELTITVAACPADTTTVVIDLGPATGPAILDASGAAADGAATLVVTLPADAPAGDYLVRAWCKDDGASTVATGEATLIVAHSHDLPPSGASPAVWWAAALVMLGALLLLAAKVSSPSARR